MNKNVLKGLLFSVLFFIALPIMAQDENKEEQNKMEKNVDGKKWNFTAAPYILFLSMDGDVGIRGLPIDVDASTGDIFDNLDFGVMFFFEARNDKWAVNFDLLYMNLGKEGVTPLLSRNAEADVKQLAITVEGLYRLNPWLEVGLGGRLNAIDASVTIAAGDYILPGLDFSMSETWFDPLIVTRAMTQLNNKWRLGMLANIGGFGMGSDFAWEINPIVGYQFSKLFEIDIAYRWLGMDYETGTGTDYFKYDMVISGPEIGLLFHF